MPKSGLLERQASNTEFLMQATKETYIQFMVDMFEIALNDKEIMGKDVLGAKRIKKVIEAVGANYDKYHGAIEPLKKNQEREALRVILDERLRKFAGDELVPFQERYEFVERDDGEMKPIKANKPKTRLKQRRKR